MLKVLAGYPVKLRRRRANFCFGTGLLGSARIASRAATTWLGFTQFKRRRQGNLQVGGTERPGVPECRGQRLGFVQCGIG